VYRYVLAVAVVNVCSAGSFPLGGTNVLVLLLHGAVSVGGLLYFIAFINSCITAAPDSYLLENSVSTVRSSLNVPRVSRNFAGTWLAGKGWSNFAVVSSIV